MGCRKRGAARIIVTRLAGWAALALALVAIGACAADREGQTSPRRTERNSPGRPPTATIRQTPTASADRPREGGVTPPRPVTARKPSPDSSPGPSGVRPDLVAPPAPSQSAAAGQAVLPSGGAPKFRCDQPTYEFPDTWAGDFVEHTWTVCNDGAGVLQIPSVQPTCGCAVAEFDQEVQPGGRGKIKAKLDTKGMNYDVTKILVVKTNDPAMAQVALMLKGKVRARIGMEPASGAQLFQGITGGNLTQTVTLTNNTAKPLRLEPGPATPQALFSYELKEVSPGKTYQLIVTAEKSLLKEGHNFSQIALKTNIREEPDFFVPVNMFVQPIVQVMPELIAVATPVAGVFHRDVTLTYHGTSPMKITAVGASDPAIKVQAVQIPGQPQTPGQSWKLLVDIAQGWNPPPTPTQPPIEITVQTDVKERPQLKIRVYTYPQKP